MIHDQSATELIAKLKHISKTSPTDAMDEALRLRVWYPDSAWHREEILIYCAHLAVELYEYRLAGLAAYHAQRLHMRTRQHLHTLPNLPGLEVAARRFNLIRYTPVKSRNIQLRCPRLSDRDFLLGMFRNPEFARLYSRPMIGHEEGKVYRLIKGDQRFPNDDDPWAWIICDMHGAPIGILELNQLDFAQSNADFSMGFNIPHFGTLAAEAFSLGTAIAFYHLSLQRVTHHIYGENSDTHRLHERIGSVKEYTLDGIVNDPQTGRPSSMTIYSMTTDEAMNSPWLKQVQRFCPSLPDLLSDQIEEISKDILSLGPRWKIFPPQVLPEKPAPPTPQVMPVVEMPIPPMRILGRRIKLMTPSLEDRNTIYTWINTAGFIKSYTNTHLPIMDVDTLAAGLGYTPGKIMLWLIESIPQQRKIGLVGLEIINNLPVLFVLSGFTTDARLRDISESWQLLRKVLRDCYPNARVYFKIPEDSPLYRMVNGHHDFLHCGIERFRPCITEDRRIHLGVMEFVGNIATD